MPPRIDQMRPILARYEDLAQAMEHSMLQPALTDDDVIAGCRLARAFRVAGVSVRPCDVDLAVRELQDSAVKIGSVAGFPHGSATTAVKLYEARDALRRGARQIGVVLNIARLRSRQFQYVETELLQMADACHKEGALLTVIFENAWLSDEVKIVACRLCLRAGADFAATSTGFADSGYTPEDARLMRANLREEVGLTASGGVSSLEKAKEAYETGCDRISTSATAAILDAWKAEIGPTLKS